MNIRQIKKSDAKEFSRLRSGEDTYKWFYSNKKFTEEEVLNWISNLDCEKEAVFVAELNSKVVGTVSLHEMDKDQKDTEIGRIIVDESARGQGLGTKLLKYALDYAKSQNFECVYANVMVNNVSSQRIFEKNNFTLVEIRPNTGHYYEYRFGEDEE